MQKATCTCIKSQSNNYRLAKKVSHDTCTENDDYIILETNSWLLSRFDQIFITFGTFLCDPKKAGTAVRKQWDFVLDGQNSIISLALKEKSGTLHPQVKPTGHEVMWQHCFQKGRGWRRQWHSPWWWCCLQTLFSPVQQINEEWEFPSLCEYAILMRYIFNYVHSRGNCSSSSVSGPAKECGKTGFQPYLTLGCEEGDGSSSPSRPCIIHEHRKRHLTVVHLSHETWQDELVWVALWNNFCNITNGNT